MEREQLQQALAYQQAGISGTAIANLVNVLRHVARYALGSFRRQTALSDIELDDIVRGIVAQNPYAGHVFVRARLRVRCVHVSRNRVRESMRRVGSATTELRRHRVLRRRRYSVPHFNFLWHVDGYHKLIRWKIVIHGGIDGFSRVCAYLVAASDNTALTAFSAFLTGVSTFGAPRFLRVDAGGENELLRRYVTYIRGAQAVIVGRSVHNQRIERMWRDVFREVVCVYYDVLRRLEASGALNVQNQQHIARLHTLLLPVLNAALVEFQQAWNEHGVRTERHCTPMQISLRSHAQNADKDGCADVEQHRDAARQLQGATQLRGRLIPPICNAMLDCSRETMLAALRNELQRV